MERTHRALWSILAASAVCLLFAGPLAANDLLDPVSHPKFVNPLPVPSVIDLTRTSVFAPRVPGDGDAGLSRIAGGWR